MASHAVRRVLIVEDEFLVAMLLEDILAEMGHHVVACATRLDEATKLAGDADIDLAILDVSLNGQKSFPVAEVLRRRGIPFIFATGYGTEGLVDGFCDEPRLQKPYDPRQLARAIAVACEPVSG